MAEIINDNELDKKLDYLNPDIYREYLDMLHSEEYQRLQDIYCRKTTMDILGVARQENPHSSFISWLLNPIETHGLNDYAIKKFCETMCFAYLKYANSYLNTDSYEKEITEDKYVFEKDTDEWKSAKKTIIDKLLFSNKKRNLEITKRLMNGSFEIIDFKIYREKKTRNNVSRRADIWIDFIISIDRKKDPIRLLFLIENKVTSNENDNQTVKYVEDIAKRFMDEKDSLNSVNFFVPIYLYVADNNEMKDAVNSDLQVRFPCKSRLYLVINYQYLMDGVFAPCLARASEKEIVDKLDEYINCLGKSIGDSTDDTDNGKNKKNIVMAVSPREKVTALKLWNKYERILSDIGVQMSGDHFVISDENDRQFYRTILRPVIDELYKTGNPTEVQLAEDIRGELNDKKEYYLRFKNGKTVLFKSQGGQNKNISALAYYLLRQYLEDNKEKDKPETLTEIREKLYKKIGNKWLSGFFITDDDAESYYNQWKTLNDNLGCVVCSRYSGMPDPMDGCPLSESSSSILGKNFCSKKNNGTKLPDDMIKTYLMEKTCPCFSETENYALRIKCFGSINNGYKDMIPQDDEMKRVVDNCKVMERGKGCSCIYDFIHCFFIGGFRDNHLDIFDKEGDNLKKIGYNDILPAVEYADNRWVYISKWWFSQDVEKMIEALWEGKKCPYLSINSQKTDSNLTFDSI